MAGCALVRIAHEKPQAVIPLLTKRLTSWPAAVEKAAVLLGVIGPEAHAALSALRKTLRHERQEARNAAAFALQAIDPSEPHGQQLPSDTDLARQLCLPVKHSLVKLVKTLVDDRNTTAQLQVLWKVAQMGYEAEPALPFLHEAMKKTWLHHDAAGAIARVDPEFIRPLIPELLRDFKTAKLDGDFGDRVISFLAYLGPELQPDAVEFLLSCLPVLGKKPRAAARMIPYAVQKLATTKPETLAPLINRLLQTRWEADEDILNPTTPILNLLKQSGAVYADAVDAVAGKLSSKFHAPLALETLWRIGSWTTVLPHVESLLASADPDIRAAAKECVGKLAKSAKRTDIPALQRAAEHSLPDVQQAAKSALKRMDKK